jgi:hypothetical protein
MVERIARFSALATLVFLFTPALAHLPPADEPKPFGPESPPINKTIRLHQGSRPAEDCSILFFARKGRAKDRSLFGHAWVAWYKNDAQNRACVQRGFGFFPENDSLPEAVKSKFVEVPGVIADDPGRQKPASGECRLIVQVNEVQYATAELVMKSWKKGADYRLGKQDCVTFASEIAKALRLKLPDRAGFLYPEDFIIELARLNR